MIRPFNWIGPKLDDLYAAKEGSSRVVTQFILNLLQREPIKLVDGGYQKRCFTFVEDGIDCLMRIIENDGGVGRRPDLQHRQPRKRSLDKRVGASPARPLQGAPGP